MIKGKITHVLASLIGIAALLMIAWSIAGNYVVPAKAPALIVNAKTQEMDELPVDPNAYKVRFEDPYAFMRKYLKYETTTTGLNVIAFYKDQLYKKGWVVEFEEYTDPTDTGILFKWQDPDGTLGYDLLCFLEIYDTRLANSDNKGPAYVSISLMRVPKLSKVPLYEGATHVQTKIEDVPTALIGQTISQQTITYLTNATISQVQSFYEATLPEYGWSALEAALEPGTDKPIPGSLAWNWTWGSIHDNAMGASVGVLTEQNKDGTKVELRIRGETYFGR
jgi:hypothetical protein